MNEVDKKRTKKRRGLTLSNEAWAIGRVVAERRGMSVSTMMEQYLRAQYEAEVTKSPDIAIQYKDMLKQLREEEA